MIMVAIESSIQIQANISNSLTLCDKNKVTGYFLEKRRGSKNLRMWEMKRLHIPLETYPYGKPTTTAPNDM